MAQKQAQTTAAEAAPPPKKRGKLLLIVSLVLVLAGGGGGAAWFFMKPADPNAAAVAKPKPALFMPLEVFTANLAADEGQPQFIQVGLTLKTTEQETIDLVKERMPEVRNRILMVLSGKRGADLLPIAGKEKLATELATAVQAAVGGATSTEIIDGRKRVPVVVRLAAAYRGTPDAIGQLMLTTPSGGKVLLSQVARVDVVEGPELINHENGERMVIVQSNVRGRDLGSFAADVQRAVAAGVALPERYFVTYGGQFENQQRAMMRLAVIVPLVLLLIVALLYASFGNGRQALLVMLNVPFALVGGICALWLRGLNLNLSASVGFIALFGIAVLNGVVLISYLNQLRDEGRPLDEAVRQGSEIRLRPVLMTALVASFGFIPMALSTSPGSEVQRPLATVVIGGLITSTVLTLVVLPLLYEWLEERWPDWAATMHRRIRRGRAPRSSLSLATSDRPIR